MKNFYTITEQNLRSIIRSILEARSSQHHTGKKLSNIHKFDLKKMSQETLKNGAPKYYFSMHHSSKDQQNNYGGIKINLHQKYTTTPLGIYCYPLNGEFYEKLINKKLPYQTEADLFTIIMPSDPSKMLYIKSKDSEEYNIYKNIKYNNLRGNKDTKKIGKLKFASNDIIHMRKDLISAGYNSVFDNGTGSIHKNEPKQAVFLTSNSFKVVDQFMSKDLHYKEISDEEKEKFKKIKLISKILELHKLWMDSNKIKGKKFDINNYSKDFLKDANLIYANLIGANLQGANLSYANLKRSDLQGANLSDACLIGADLTRANLIDVNLQGANLSDAYLIGANLVSADLIGANLYCADLIGADLIGANLQGSNLQGANLIGADLEDANLTNANLKDANLLNCKINKQTQGISEELIQKFNIEVINN